jgi:hypothetical protein
VKLARLRNTKAASFLSYVEETYTQKINVYTKTNMTTDELI